MFQKYQSDFYPEECSWNIKVTSSGRMFQKYQSDFFRKDVPEISKWLLIEGCSRNIKVTSSGRIFLKYQSDFVRKNFPEISKLLFRKDIPKISKWLFPEGSSWNNKVISSERIFLKYQKNHSSYSKLNPCWRLFIGYECTDLALLFTGSVFVASTIQCGTQKQKK